MGLSSCRRSHQSLLVDGGDVVAATLHAKYRRRERYDVHAAACSGRRQLRCAEIGVRLDARPARGQAALAHGVITL